MVKFMFRAFISKIKWLLPPAKCRDQHRGLWGHISEAVRELEGFPGGTSSKE